VAAADRLDLYDYSIPPAFVSRLGGPLRRGPERPRPGGVLDDVRFVVTGVAAPGFDGTVRGRRDIWLLFSGTTSPLRNRAPVPIPGCGVVSTCCAIGLGPVDRSVDVVERLRLQCR
jgi:hypothetical protein